jgi:hypothetical protein
MPSKLKRDKIDMCNIRCAKAESDAEKREAKKIKIDYIVKIDDKKKHEFIKDDLLW